MLQEEYIYQFRYLRQSKYSVGFQIAPLWVPVLFIDIVVVDLRKETVSAPPGSLVTREDSLMESLQVCRLSTRGSNTEGLEGRSKGRNRVWLHLSF